MLIKIYLHINITRQSLKIQLNVIKLIEIQFVMKFVCCCYYHPKHEVGLCTICSFFQKPRCTKYLTKQGVLLKIVHITKSLSCDI